MTYYILKLVIMLPVMAGLIYGSLWIYRKYQNGPMQGALGNIGGLRPKRELKLVETMAMGTSGKLAVVEFGGQKILLSSSRGSIQHIASVALDEEAMDQSAGAPANSLTTDDATGSEMTGNDPAQSSVMPFQALIKNALQAARKKEA
jgi:flagellar protein FliO/FliZ